jgi:hypothetical protein
MAECTSGELVVLVMSPEESAMVVHALMELWENNDVFAQASDYSRGLVLGLMDSIGIV